jgi:hypothetical protein
MANGSGAAFDGDGSVQWEVVTVDDETRKSEALPYGDDGRRTKGADKRHGEYFRIDFIVPKFWSGPFAEQFTDGRGKKPGDTITIYLPIEQVPRQIEVHWSQGIIPEGGTTQTAS